MQDTLLGVYVVSSSTDDGDGANDELIPSVFERRECRERYHSNPPTLSPFSPIPLHSHGGLVG